MPLGILVEALEARRLLSAGEVDPTFGQGGFAYYADSVPARAMAVQPGGKILVAEDNGFLERFNPDGSRDQTFGPNGNGMSSISLDIVGLAVDAQGRIVVGGNGSGGADWVVARLNADGSPDGTFNGTDAYDGGANSVRYLPPSTLVGTREGAAWFALQRDGKVLLGGYFNGGETDPNVSNNFGGTTDSNVELIRLNTDGTLDTSFGDRGEAITRNGDWTTYGTGRALLVRPNGQIVVTGLVHPAIEGAAGFQTVFNPAGDLISDGYVGSGPYTEWLVGAVRPEGGVFIATEQVLGYRQTLLDIDERSVRFAFNTTFAQNWPGSPGNSGNFGVIDAALATPDSKVLLATGGGDEIALARIDASGAPDLTFGLGGTATLKLDVYHDGWTGTQSATALAQTADGDILVAGEFHGRLFLSRIQGGSHIIGHGAPQVSVAAREANPFDASSQGELTLNVHIFGDNPIEVSTIDEQDFLVTGPGGYSALGKFSIAGSQGADRLPVDVLFDFAPPAAGAFSDGTYTVQLVGQILDTRGRAVATGVVGNFTLPLNVEANYAPDSPFVADLLAPYGPEAGQHFVTFRARFHSAAGIDFSTLYDTNFNVARGDGISTPAEFVSAQLSDDGETAIATYRVGAPRGGNWDDIITESYRFNYPAEGQFDIHLEVSPRDKAGHTVAGYYGPDVYSSLDGNFTSQEYTTQPTAKLEGIDVPTAAGSPVTFRIRYTPEANATMNLSSIADKAVWVDPVNAPQYRDPDWAHLDRAEVAADGSVLATYSVVGNGSAGLLGIHIGSTRGYSGASASPRDSTETAVPNGLLGTFDMDYARRRPAATLLTTSAPASPRRYVTFAVRYSSFAGIRTGMLDDWDLVVTGPNGYRARARFERVDDVTDPSAAVAYYFVRLPPGMTDGADFRVTVQARQVRDLCGRRLSAGAMGSFSVGAVAGAGALTQSPVMSGVRRKVNEVLEG